MKTTVYLNIGSNTGDRRAFIARAVAALYNLPGVRVERVRLSQPAESPPWGYASGNAYVNVGAAVDADIDRGWSEEALMRMLSYVQAEERNISAVPHRNADGSYRDREIDIDIIAVDGMVCCLPALVLPHPRMHLRTFVLGPMAELAPAWKHPLTGLTAARMLSSIK